MFELLVLGVPFAPPTTAIDYIQQKPAIVIEAPVEETPVEETLAYKIENDVNKCEPERYIRADNAECGGLRPDRPGNTQNRSQTIKSASQRVSGGRNGYDFGNCTYYVQNTLGWVPNGWHNANTWDDYARAQGYTVTQKPIVGAIAQSNGGYYGHVAAVTGVHSDGSVTVSEMNYKGFNVVSSRRVPSTAFSNYIY